MSQQTFKAENTDIGKRIDVFVAERSGLTRSASQKVLAEGGITVNGKAIKKNYKISENDIVDVELPEPTELDCVPEDIPVDIVYEDEYLAVVNKPKGMVVHPAPGNYTGTLVNALLYHMKGRLSSINGVIRPGIVHRIDKNTSGLLMIAKTDEAHLGLAEQIKDHSFERIHYPGTACSGPPGSGRSRDSRESLRRRRWPGASATGAAFPTCAPGAE